MKKDLIKKEERINTMDRNTRHKEKKKTRKDVIKEK